MRYSLQAIGRHLGRSQRLGDDGCNGSETVVGLATAFENGGISGFDGEGGDVGNDFWARFEDDEKDADGAGYPGQEEVVVEKGPGRGLVDLFVLELELLGTIGLLAAKRYWI